MGCHQSERRWLLDGLTPIEVPLPYIKTTERSISIYCIGASEDLETFYYSRLRRNFASVVCEGQCKAFIVGHSLRPTASVQCKGDNAVSCGRKAVQRASFPPCWSYMAHQCRRRRHRRVNSCCFRSKAYSEFAGTMNRNDLEMFQIHIRYLLLDTVTGYRSQYQNLSALAIIL